MKHDHTFDFECIACAHPITFSLTELEKPVACDTCRKTYALQDEALKQQLKKFADLCWQIKESEEILGNAAIAVEVGTNKVQVPFKLLLTRLKSTLNLQIGDKKVLITFRTETTKKELCHEPA